MTGQSLSFSMHRILPQDQSGGVYASTSSVHWRAEVGARVERGVPHPPTGKCLGGAAASLPGHDARKPVIRGVSRLGRVTSSMWPPW